MVKKKKSLSISQKNRNKSIKRGKSNKLSKSIKRGKSNKLSKSIKRGKSIKLSKSNKLGKSNKLSKSKKRNKSIRTLGRQLKKTTIQRGGGCDEVNNGVAIISTLLTSIKEEAFVNCSELRKVTIPKTITSIGAGAFEGCVNLTDVTIPDSVTSIGEGAFFNCNGLSTMTIPDSVTSMGEGAFDGCTGLKEVVIEEGVEIIAKEAFLNCSELTSVTIPKSVKEIGEGAFEGCENLTKVMISNEANTFIKAAEKAAFPTHVNIYIIDPPLTATNIARAEAQEKQLAPPTAKAARAPRIHNQPFAIRQQMAKEREAKILSKKPLPPPPPIHGANIQDARVNSPHPSFVELNATAAEQRVTKTGRHGAYVLRGSESRKGNLSLTVFLNEQAKHFKIKKDTDGYHIGQGEPGFLNVRELIKHYEDVHGVGTNFGTKLTFAEE